MSSKSNYLKCMMEKVENFMRRKKFKHFYIFKKKKKRKRNLENKPQDLFGFKS